MVSGAAACCPAVCATKHICNPRSQHCCVLARENHRLAFDWPPDTELACQWCCCSPVGTYNTGGNTAGCQKCGSGLTTRGPRAANASMCLAPAGSYVERGTGKACQKGTYSEELNN
jgi:hypothetical protein